MSGKPTWLLGDIATVLRGMCMGCADIIPGVSGGTVALILGIYPRLVAAISHCDLTLLDHLRRRQWKQAVIHVDLRFLLGLGTGIGAGLVGMALLVNRLLTDPFTRSVTLAAFFGMIFASALVLATLIRTASRIQRFRCLAMGLGAASFAFWITTLHGGAGGYSEPSYAYLFFCGSVAICAMILPGISGAMILLVLGVYVHLTEVPHHLLAGDRVGECLVTIMVFGSGCGISLVCFSKVLRWLLARHHAVTMSTLCGFMVGALRKLWPFQEDVTPHLEKFKEKEFRLVWPDALDGQFAAVLVAAAAAMAIVLAVDRLSRRSQGTSQGDELP